MIKTIDFCIVDKRLDKKKNQENSLSLSSMSYNPDLYWKGGIEDVFPELLCLVFKDAASLFDLERQPEFLDSELLQLFPEAGTKPDSRHVDKLVRVYGKEGKPELLLIHVEIVRLVSLLFNCFNSPQRRIEKPVFL